MASVEIIIRHSVRRSCEASPEGFTEQACAAVKKLGNSIVRMSDQLGDMEDYEIRFTAELVRLRQKQES